MDTAHATGQGVVMVLAKVTGIDFKGMGVIAEEDGKILYGLNFHAHGFINVNDATLTFESEFSTAERKELFALLDRIAARIVAELREGLSDAD